MSKEKRKDIVKRNLRRDDRVEFALDVALDQDRADGHFWDAILTYSIKRASDSADKLSRRVFWLNVILIVIGVLSLLVVGYGAFCK